MALRRSAYLAMFAFAVAQHSGAQTLPDPDSGGSSATTHVWVQHQGRLSTVHRQGDASPTVNLSTVIDSVASWAIGPLAGLRGEISVIDGRPFVARVVDDTIAISHDADVDAPFLAYGSVKRWQEASLPDSVRTISDLEHWLARLSDSMSVSGRPEEFPFKITTSRSDVYFHVISNQEPGYQISRPHHELMRFFALRSQPVTLLGVFSEHHAGVFTHHDQWTHIHVVSADHRVAGHADSLSLGSDAVLFLPEGK